MLMQVPITEREFYAVTDSLSATEAASAAVATAPRVTKAFIESQLARVLFFTGDVAIAGAEYAIGKSDPWKETQGPDQYTDGAQQEFEHHTYCVLQTRAGFTVTGHSAPASPENFNAELGRQLAYENAFRQLWPLFAFAALEMTDMGNTYGDFGQHL